MATTTTRPQIRHRSLDGLVRPSRWPQLVAETRCDGPGRPRADAGQLPAPLRSRARRRVQQQPVLVGPAPSCRPTGGAGRPGGGFAAPRHRPPAPHRRPRTDQHLPALPRPASSPRPASPRQAALLRMLVVALAGRHVKDADPAQGADRLWPHPQVDSCSRDRQRVPGLRCRRGVPALRRPAAHRQDRHLDHARRARLTTVATLHHDRKVSMTDVARPGCSDHQPRRRPARK